MKLGRIVYCVSGVIATILVAFGVLVLLSYPQYTYSVHITNPRVPTRQTIKIYRENDTAIPHILAQTRDDAIYALGWVHAQDRAWQMHFKRLTAAGRLSEIAGEETLMTDKFFRSVGLKNTASIVAENLTNATREWMQSYCDGINDYMASVPAHGIEFALTGSKWYNWTIPDTFSYHLMMDLFMSLDFLHEPQRTTVRDRYDEEFAHEIFASRPKYHIESVTILNEDDLAKEKLKGEPYKPQKGERKYDVNKIPDYVRKMILNLTQIQQLETAHHGGVKGSNSWVVSGKHTRSGKPILANDPHLDVLAPCFWYPVEMIFTDGNGTQKASIGFTLAGSPLLQIGRSDYAAWGITNNMVDSSDLYVEKLSEDLEKYFFDNKWVKLHRRYEYISVRGRAEPIKFIVFSTHHGPILDSVFDLGDHLHPHKYDYALALSWGGHRHRDGTFQATADIQVAASLQDIQNAIPRFTTPILNIVFATVDGHIGYFTLGQLAVKTDPGNPFLRNGTLRQNDLVRFFKGDETPRVTDPEKGYIVTANNKLAPDTIIHQVSASSVPLCRSYYIDKLIRDGIAQQHKFTVADFREMQLDVTDGYCLLYKSNITYILEQGLTEGGAHWRVVKRLFDATQIEDLNLTLQTLQNWNCEMREDSHGAALYGVWEQRMLTKFLRNATTDWRENLRLVSHLSFDHFFFYRLQNWTAGENLHEHYCNTENGEDGEYNPSCIIAFFEAFFEANLHLKRLFGTDRYLWQWGDVNAMRFVHSPFSKTPLRPIFERSLRGRGNRRTINVGGVNLTPNQNRILYSSNMRMVVSLDDSEPSYYIIDTGVSENPFSPHYDDQMKLFAEGKFIEMRRGASRLDEENDLVQTITFGQSADKANTDL